MGFKPLSAHESADLGNGRRSKLGEALFAKVGQQLQERGFKVNTGTIVDATIIGAPSSTKNADKARDPEMHQTRKGQQWYFGMKLHIGVDSQSGLAHAQTVEQLGYGGSRHGF